MADKTALVDVYAAYAYVSHLLYELRTELLVWIAWMGWEKSTWRQIKVFRRLRKLIFNGFDFSLFFPWFSMFFLRISFGFGPKETQNGILKKTPIVLDVLRS